MRKGTRSQPGVVIEQIVSLADAALGRVSEATEQRLTQRVVFPHQQFTQALRILDDLAKPTYAAKLKKAKKTLRLLRDVGPTHPGLNSHKYQSLTGPNGEDVWESYVENRTLGAWRMWWLYGPTPGTLTILTLGPHPQDLKTTRQARDVASAGSGFDASQDDRLSDGGPSGKRGHSQPRRAPYRTYRPRDWRNQWHRTRLG